MKKMIWGTIALFVTVLIVTLVIAERHGVHEVEYKNGVVTQVK